MDKERNQFSLQIDNSFKKLIKNKTDRSVITPNFFEIELKCIKRIFFGLWQFE